MSDDGDVPAPVQPGVYKSDEIILYGVKLNLPPSNHASFYAGEGHELHAEMVNTGTAPPPSTSSIVLAYGYAYEGHCYRFDKTRVFVVEPTDEDPIGCGFDLELRLANPIIPPTYRMWRIRGATEILEISTNFGEAKDLILDASLPGKRAPNTYSINFQMAHRGRPTRE